MNRSAVLTSVVAVLAIGVAVVAFVLVGGGDEPLPSNEPSGPVDVSTTPDVAAPQFVLDVGAAIEAVEEELDGPQQYFEVTSNTQFTNVFVAVDDATAAVAYAYVDGELQPPAPKQAGASGSTFAATDIDFLEDRILSGVAADLPESEIDAISVYGDGFGTTYVLAATSTAGGFLDIVVGPDGAIFSVDPV